VSFWSGERLAEQLSTGLIEPYSEANLDCASYRLSVGIQSFVTADRFTGNKPSGRLVNILGDPPDHTVRIAPGQFAFLLTFETVRVPPSAIALISMRAKYKFQGLINVSGFHVDPGWDGKLLFSVYNAGPIEVVIERHEPLFLIVYADLDRTSAKTYKGHSQHQDSIKPALLQNMLSQVFSPLMLQRRVDELADHVSFLKTVAWTLVSVVGLTIAVAQLFPNAVGAVLGTVLEAAGYEMARVAPGK
jgi:dCTP deaminase